MRRTFPYLTGPPHLCPKHAQAAIRDYSYATMTKLLAVTALGAALALAACASDHAKPFTAPPVDPYATEAGFCQESAKAACNAAVVQACYNSDDKTLAADTASCIAAHAKVGNCNPTALDYHPSGGQACVAAAAAALADAKVTYDEALASIKACHAAFSKSGAKGATCSNESDCDGSKDLHCVLHGATGSCQTPTTIMPGMDCSAPEAGCTDEFYCDAGKHCVAKQASGMTCSKDPMMLVPCDSKSTCGSSNTCVGKFANGAACASGDQCTGGFCIKASGQMMGSCGSSVTLASTNDACAPFKP